VQWCLLSCAELPFLTPSWSLNSSLLCLVSIHFTIRQLRHVYLMSIELCSCTVYCCVLVRIPQIAISVMSIDLPARWSVCLCVCVFFWSPMFAGLCQITVCPPSCRPRILHHWIPRVCRRHRKRVTLYVFRRWYWWWWWWVVFLVVVITPSPAAHRLSAAVHYHPPASGTLCSSCHAGSRRPHQEPQVTQAECTDWWPSDHPTSGDGSASDGTHEHWNPCV